MATEEETHEETMDTTVPEMWRYAKPPAEGEPAADQEEATSKKKAAPGARIGRLIKYLNDIEEAEELETKLQERDPATGQSLLLWATLNSHFVLVEWLVKKAKRAAFAFSATTPGKEITIYDKWIEIRKEIEEKEKEKAANPPEETNNEDDEEKAPEPTPEQLVFEALSDLHEEWGARGQGLVKLIGEVGVFQGARDATGTKQGLGQTLFPNGDMYCGEYKDNKRHGTGTYFFADDGMIYTGQWNNNIRHGVGRMIYPDGGRYYGGWVNDKREGEGRYTYPDGSVYNGSWEDDYKRGKGTLSFVDGSEYVGTFTDNEFTCGEWRLAGSTRYYGNFNAGVPNGMGVFVYKYGKEGSYRQEGMYEQGVWKPGKIALTNARPTLELAVQGQMLTLAFSEECGALSIQQLWHVANYEPFLEWVRSLEGNHNVFVQGITIASVWFDECGDVSAVSLKLVAVDAEGKRLRKTENLMLKKPCTRVLLLLVGDGKTSAILQHSPNAVLGASEQLTLPSVKVHKAGVFTGEFARHIKEALGLELSSHNTVAMEGMQGVRHCISATSSTSNVILCIQPLHADAMATLQQRLDGVTGAVDDAFFKLRAVRLADVSQLSTDALTVATGLTAILMQKTNRLPDATAAARRPPTPLPPEPEPRPNIEPLLDAERKSKQPAAAEGDGE